MTPLLQLYTPRYVNTTGSSNTFSLFVSAEQYRVPNQTTFYYGFDVPKPGIHTYRTPFAPLRTTSVLLRMTYPAVGEISFTASGELITYRGGQYRKLAAAYADDNIPLPDPTPIGYIDQYTGRIIFESTDSSYNTVYNTGPTEVAINKNYIIEPFFAHNFFARDITIDFGDDTVTTYQYHGQQADTFTHAYSAQGTYMISATAQFVTGSNVDQYTTLTSQFSSAIVITGDDI